jgi:D-proline reductase (dithiol) PrdB
MGHDAAMSSDALVRQNVNDIDAFDFGTTVASTAPRLRDARIAIVTTAGLRADGSGTWTDGQGFVTLDARERRLLLAHASVNFDRVGLMADLNVAYPADRLDELAERGVIGSVATNHLSFMGAQTDHNLTTLRLDTGPAAAQQLLDDGVQVVFITPV